MKRWSDVGKLFREGFGFVVAFVPECCRLGRVPLVSLFLGKSELKVRREKNYSPSTRVLVLFNLLALCFGISLISGMKFFKGGGYSDPGYPFTVLLFSGRGSVELVVVPIVLSTFKLFCLSFRTSWARLFQVGRALAPSVVAQFLSGPLERVLLRASGVFTVSVFRASAKLLQMCFLRSSGFLVLERTC